MTDESYMQRAINRAREMMADPAEVHGSDAAEAPDAEYVFATVLDRLALPIDTADFDAGLHWFAKTYEDGLKLGAHPTLVLRGVFGLAFFAGAVAAKKEA